MVALRLTRRDGTTRIYAEDGRGSAAQFDDDDDVLDGWLASLSIGQFERILSGLADRHAGAPAVLDPPA